MAVAFRGQDAVRSWSIGAAIAVALAGCGQPSPKHASQAEPPQSSASEGVPAPAAGPAGPGDAAAASAPEDAAQTEPLRAPTSAAAESRPHLPATPRRGIVKGQVPAPVPRNPPVDALPETAARDGEPVLMRLDEPDVSDEMEPLHEETATSPAVPATSYTMVDVFYATDRQRLDADLAIDLFGKPMRPVLAGAGLALLLAVIGLFGWQRRRMFVWAGVIFALTASWGVVVGKQQLNNYRVSAQRGVRYGNQRGVLEFGTCQVSIPATHEVGEIERPSLLRLEVRDDVRKHVVLHETRCQEADAFYQQLRDRVLAAPRPEVFVFVHGYNVTFEGAAQRTAQIAHDVQFAGAPIFFSWPSQGGLLKYTVDETNVEWAVPHLKQLLLDVATRSGAESVNLIAHSMGNRALTAALRDLHRELDSEAALFNQIILAAPDIDAEIFCRDLAPALTQTSRRVTLYASSNDQALAASKKVHGYARAGDSGAGLVVLPDIETIDVSMLDTNLLGHSYYGSSNPILLDIRQLIEFALPAAQRHWLLPKPHGELIYWVFNRGSDPTPASPEEL